MKGRRYRRPDAPPAGGSGREPSDEDLFLAEVADATPLSDRDRVRPPRRRPRRPGAAAPPRAPPLAVERDGERVEARAPGVSDAQLAPLRAGKVEPEAHLDLHRMRTDDAVSAVDEFIRAAASAGRRCVLVIPGRGRRTGGVSVVKEDVIDHLSAGRIARHVRAFATAAPRHGGAGALTILLKRT